MLSKLIVVIVAVGMIASTLLVIRQQRIDAAHEMSLIHTRMMEHQRTLWRIRGEIAERCRPSEIRLVMNKLEMDWQPIPARPTLLSDTPQPGHEQAPVRLARPAATSQPLLTASADRP